MKSGSLIEQIIETANARGMTQKALAARADVPEETLSRAKKRGSTRLVFIERLAHAAGVEIGIVGAAGTAPRRSAPASGSFRDKHGVALAWSNTAAPDDLLVRRALVKPRFHVLLDAAVEFGVDSLAREWSHLKAEGSPEALKASKTTERILAHIRDGYQQATA